MKCFERGKIFTNTYWFNIRSKHCAFSERKNSPRSRQIRYSPLPPARWRLARRRSRMARRRASRGSCSPREPVASFSPSLSSPPSGPRPCSEGEAPPPRGGRRPARCDAMRPTAAETGPGVRLPPLSPSPRPTLLLNCCDCSRSLATIAAVPARASSALCTLARSDDAGLVDDTPIRSGPAPDSLTAAPALASPRCASSRRAQPGVVALGGQSPSPVPGLAQRTAARWSQSAPGAEEPEREQGEAWPACPSTPHTSR